jgi:hypothetical protein
VQWQVWQCRSIRGRPDGWKSRAKYQCCRIGSVSALGFRCAESDTVTCMHCTLLALLGDLRDEALAIEGRNDILSSAQTQQDAPSERAFPCHTATLACGYPRGAAG